MQSHVLLTCLMPSLRKTCLFPRAQRTAAGEAGAGGAAAACTARSTAAHAAPESLSAPRRHSARYRPLKARNRMRCGYPLAINCVVSSICNART